MWKNLYKAIVGDFCSLSVLDILILGFGPAVFASIWYNFWFSFLMTLVALFFSGYLKTKIKSGD